jgi:hypothetical protein
MTAPGPTDTLSLVADIGGTNTRVALARGRRSTPPACAATATPSMTGSPRSSPPISTCRHHRRPDRRRLRRGRGTGARRRGATDQSRLAHRPRRAGQVLTAEKVLRPERPAGAGPCDRQYRGGEPDRGPAAAAHSPHAAKLVMGIGTGFNACPVFDTEAGRFVPPSEAGHVACPSPCRASAAIWTGSATAMARLRRGGPVGPRRQHASRRASRRSTCSPADILAAWPKATPRRWKPGGSSCR